MKQRIIYNGTLIKKETVRLSLENRGFRYGDGIFETIRVFDGKVPFLNQHIERLSLGIETLQLALPIVNNVGYWHFEIKRLIKFYQQNDSFQVKNYRLRLSVFRNDGGLYTPLTNKASYILELSPLTNPQFVWNKKGTTIDIFPDVRLSYDNLSNLKTSNGLPFVLAALYNKKNGLGDCLLLNVHNRIAESIHSNVFFIIKNTLITPMLKEGCIAGTTRKTVIEVAQKMGMTVKEKKCKVDLLQKASEVFMTNSIRGIQWVEHYNDIKYTCKKSKQIHKELNKLIQKSIITI